MTILVIVGIFFIIWVVAILVLMSRRSEEDPSMLNEKWPFIPAANFTGLSPGTKRHVRLIVIHSMESAEKGDTAESCARYFQQKATKASAHICVDNNSIIRCVMDDDIAWAAPGANHDGIHIELAGRAAQTRAEWLDLYGLSLINLAGMVVAQYAVKYNLPLTHIPNSALASPVMGGIVGHYQVTEVFKRSTHTDPGLHFPWEELMERAAAHKQAMLIGKF